MGERVTEGSKSRSRPFPDVTSAPLLRGVGGLEMSGTADTCVPLARNSSLGQVRRLDYLNSRNSFSSRFTGHPRRVIPKRYIHFLSSCGGSTTDSSLRTDIHEPIFRSNALKLLYSVSEISRITLRRINISLVTFSSLKVKRFKSYRGIKI